MVILVDENDKQTGIMSKMQAHREAKLHRAVSVFIFNRKGEWLLQKRAQNKYHSMGLWTNTCCTHPGPGEMDICSAERRLREEMGITCELKEIFSFIYREDLENGLTEFEYDHVFTGFSESIPVPDANEVMDWKYVNFNELDKDIQESPGSYSFWFREIFHKVNQFIQKEGL